MSRHLLISGTGRSGTSFLTRYLGACGYDIGSGDYHERARAGLEYSVFGGVGPDAPYVLKDPWLGFFCSRIDLSELQVDGLILPVRALQDAAQSRLLQERAAIAETDWRFRPTSDVMASTPGGAIYSLASLDQQRVLAVGFHNLVHWATVAGIPMTFVDFPRCVRDADYLIARLQPWLNGRVSPEQALAAFHEIAEPGLVRVFGDAGSVGDPDSPTASDSLDRAALAMLLDERENTIAELQMAIERISGELEQARNA